MGPAPPPRPSFLLRSQRPRCLPGPFPAGRPGAGPFLGWSPYTGSPRTAPRPVCPGRVVIRPAPHQTPPALGPRSPGRARCGHSVPFALINRLIKVLISFELERAHLKGYVSACVIFHGSKPLRQC